MAKVVVDNPLETRKAYKVNGGKILVFADTAFFDIL